MLPNPAVAAARYVARPRPASRGNAVYWEEHSRLRNRYLRRIRGVLRLPAFASTGQPTSAAFEAIRNTLRTAETVLAQRNGTPRVDLKALRRIADNLRPHHKLLGFTAADATVFRVMAEVHACHRRSTPHLPAHPPDAPPTAAPASEVASHNGREDVD